MADLQIPIDPANNDPTKKSKLKRADRDKNQSISQLRKKAEDKMKSKEEKPQEEEMPQEFLHDPSGVFLVLEQLGRGQYGIVSKAKNLQDNRVVALKSMKVAEVDIYGLKLEKGVTDSMVHPNLLRYYNYWGNQKEIMIEIEYCEGGSILDLMNKRDICLLEEEICEAIKQALEGLIYLHSHKKVHRDIKCANLMLNGQGVVKIGDFGVSKQLSEKMDQNHTIIGSPCWMAPEMIQHDEVYDETVDVWSLGITCIEMAEGKAPFSELPPLSALFKIVNLEGSPTLANPEEYSQEFSDFIAACLVRDPTKRLKAIQLRDHPFLKAASGPSVLLELLPNANDLIEEAVVVPPVVEEVKKSKVLGAAKKKKI